MVLDVGRVKHRADLMHRSVGSNGLAVPSNARLAADGLKNVVWTPFDTAGGSVSFGSNSTDITTATAAGASPNASREDHRHRGVRSITANGSNGLFGNVDLQAGSNIALGVTGQVVTITSLASGGSGGGGGGGSGITHSYLGYNAIGGSFETMTVRRVLTKKVTVSSAGVLQAISAYVQATNNNSVGAGFDVAVFSDSAGTPNNLIFYATGRVTDAILLDNDPGAGGVSRPRWLHRPCGMYLTAADYWIAVMPTDVSDTIQIAFDATGSDRYYTSGGDWLADWGFYSPTTTGNQYSIRASFIT